MDDKVYNPSTYPLVETAITNRIIIKDPGKEMRDDFAGQAMMALINNLGSSDFAGQAMMELINNLGSSDYVETAKIAYKYADAMMKVRNK
jgi:hypothetical protein